MPKTYQNLPLGYAMTIVTDATSSGLYVQITPGSINTPAPISASSTLVVGPFNDARYYEIEYSGNLPEITSVQSGVFSAVDDSAYAPLASPTFTGTVNMASGAKLVLNKATGVEAANAVTVNANAGVITTSALTTAASSSYLITLTNNKIIDANSIILASIAGGTNTVKDISVEAKCTAANTATLTIYNNVLLTTALDGTIIINFTVV